MRSQGPADVSALAATSHNSFASFKEPEQRGLFLTTAREATITSLKISLTKCQTGPSSLRAFRVTLLWLGCFRVWKCPVALLSLLTKLFFSAVNKVKIKMPNHVYVPYGHMMASSEERGENGIRGEEGTFESFFFSLQSLRQVR